jgi:hypothetical protein
VTSNDETAERVAEMALEQLGRRLDNHEALFARLVYLEGYVDGMGYVRDMLDIEDDEGECNEPEEDEYGV